MEELREDLDDEILLNIQFKLFSLLMYSSLALMITGQIIDTVNSKKGMLVMTFLACPLKIASVYLTGPWIQARI